MDNQSRQRLGTQTVHAGILRDSSFPGVNTPVHTSTSYRFLGDGVPAYPRYFNTPNHDAVAARLAVLEGGDAALVTSSGMAAISTTLLALLNPGDHVVMQRSLYGGTMQLARTELPRLGIDVSLVEGTDPQAFARAVRPNTRVLYIETPSNPTLEIFDLQRLAEVARSEDLVSMVDGTFAPPVMQRPLNLGFDLVIHSGTKYLAGHSDLCCGAVIGSQELIRRIHRLACLLGGSLDARACALLERSLTTLSVRVERQSANALALAQFLEKHDGVSRVYYPGLQSHTGHEVAAHQMSGYGGMVAFDLAAISGRDFLKRLRLFEPAVSLGGVESLACLPIDSTHKGLSDADLQSAGISDRLVRLSVGIEDLEDLRADLEGALIHNRP